MKARWTIFIMLVFGAGGAIAADTAKAYPSRPVRIVVGFPAGGNTDIISRAMAQKLTDRFGQTVIVENRPGAGSMIGTDYVAKATPDGHTLLLVSGAFSTQAAVLKKLPFDPARDFAWITNAVVYPFAVIVRPDARMQTIADLIALAKKSPGKLNYGSVGIGSVFHLATELFNVQAGVDIAKLNREMRAVLGETDIVKRFTDLGGTVTPTTADEFERHVANEIAKWKKIAAAKRIEIQ